MLLLHVLAINFSSVSCKVFYCMICAEGLHFSAFHLYTSYVQYIPTYMYIYMYIAHTYIHTHTHTHTHTGADVNRHTANNDHTVLSLACSGGHIGAVQYLLSQGADPTHILRVSLITTCTYIYVYVYILYIRTYDTYIHVRTYVCLIG